MTTLGITGPSGLIGKEVAKLFAAQTTTTCLLANNPQKVQAIFGPTYTVKKLQYQDPSTYKRALQNVSKLFLVCSHLPLKDIFTFLQFAKDAGVSQIVFISGIGAQKSHSSFLPKIEEKILALGFNSIFLRANWFMQNFLTMFYKDITVKKTLCFPDNGAKISFIDTKDLANVAYHFLTNPIVGNQTYDITGPQALSHRQVAKMFSAILKVKIRYECLDVEKIKNTPPWNENYLGLFQDIRDGLASTVSSVVEQTTRQPPKTMETFILENKQFWLDNLSD